MLWKEKRANQSPKSFTEKLYHGTGETPKCLQRKREEVGLHPRHPHKQPGIVMGSWNFLARKQGQVEPQDSLASQSSKSVSTKFSGRSCLEE